MLGADPDAAGLAWGRRQRPDGGLTTREGPALNPSTSTRDNIGLKIYPMEMP